MSDTFEMTLNSPITDEQWDAITDVNFDKTDRIWFHTKNGKAVEFVKVIRCKDCKFATITSGVYGSKPEVKYCDIWFPTEAEYMPLNHYCASAERKEE